MNYLKPRFTVTGENAKVARENFRTNWDRVFQDWRFSFFSAGLPSACCILSCKSCKAPPPSSSDRLAPARRFRPLFFARNRQPKRIESQLA